MNRENVLKWIAALRSGKYVQGTGVLRTTDDRYCCLGVVCDVLQPDGWIDAEKVSDATKWAHTVAYATGYLPNAIAEELGIASWETAADNRRLQMKLTEMNDSGDTFAQIADYLEDVLNKEGANG